MSGHLCLKWNNHSSAFIKSINNIQIQERYCDATIACQGKYFPVHRIILSTCSDYFNEIFERMQCPHPYIVFKDIEPKEMELLLNYMYQGEVNVIQEMLPTLIKAAEALKIKGLAVPDDITPDSDPPTRKKRSNTNNDYSMPRKMSDTRERNSSEAQSDEEKKEDEILESRKQIDDDVPKIKEEPQDNLEYETRPLQTIFVDTDSHTTDNPSSSTSIDNQIAFKTEAIYPTIDDASAFLKSEGGEDDPNHHYDEQLSWTDFTVAHSRHNMSVPEASSQDNMCETDELELGSKLLSTLMNVSGSSSGGNESKSSSSKLKPIRKRHLHAHQCPHCNYMSPWITHVRTHIMFKHTREKPFGCSTCHKRFTVKRHLVIHERIHSGEKPYQCPNCFLRFAQDGHLKRHLNKKIGCTGTKT